MKTSQNVVTLLLMMLLSFTSWAQRDTVSYLYENANHQQIDQYEFDERFEYLVLASSFSKDQIREIPFTDRRILKIDLVYTTFRESTAFDQRELDLKRLQKLVDINPGIVVNQFFEWNVIGQTGCNSSAQCLDFFHGFVIYYEEYFTSETTKMEIDSIKADLTKLNQTIVEHRKLLKVDYKRIDCEYPDSRYSTEYLTGQLDKIYECGEKYKGRVFFDAFMDYKGRVQEVRVKGNLFPCPDRLEFALKYMLQWKRGLVIGRKQYDLKVSGFVTYPLKQEGITFTGFKIDQHLIDEFHMLQQYSQCVAYETDTTFTQLLPKVKKRVVSEVLRRNNWNPELIVVDVTGSMYPFTADLLKWLRLTTQREEKHFVFFNDGDDKPTAQKSIGQTGGLYHIKSSDFAEVRDRMFEAMRSGGGGDLPENNMEALMEGVKQAQPAREVVMIADNYAFPRDPQLLAGYEGSLKIILCHTEKGINTEYLNLAKKHGFTIHTLSTDISDLQRSTLKVDGEVYQNTRKGFVKRVKF